jgi:hypothetical protein
MMVVTVERVESVSEARRAVTQSDPPARMTANDVAPTDPLEAILSELVRASADARRTRRIDQLLDVTGTLTMLADAARIDTRDTGTLQGRPRDGARIPLLLKELGIKLAALKALEGPEIAEAMKLIQETRPLAANISAKVLTALDEVGAALAAA